MTRKGEFKLKIISCNVGKMQLSVFGLNWFILKFEKSK